MRCSRAAAAALGCLVAVLGLSTCGTGTTPRTTTSIPHPKTRATSGSTTTTIPLTTDVTVSPDQGVAGTVLTFTVDVRGAGALVGEGVMFGDGVTSGANAGDIRCGEAVRADHVSTYTHAYGRPGTYRFSDSITLQTPAPSCAVQRGTARVTVIAAAPLSDATLNGAFVSPTKNIGCFIDEAQPGSLRCATFSPPRLVSMDATGSFQTCDGSQCDLGNPAMETPVLPYGSATAGGPFQCLSSREGMTCTVVGHRGFDLSRAGVRAVG